MGTRRRLAQTALALALAGAWAADGRAVTVGDGLAGVAVKRFNGAGELSEATLAGKVTVVNFWATWCEACKVELVEMEQQLKPHFGEQGLQVAFVALDKEPDQAAAWFKANMKEPAPFLDRLYVDPQFAVADKLAIDSFPMTLVIGKDGKVKHVQRGFKDGEGSTAAIVKIALGLMH
jgi:thiol-disulfide isomerase/thioredoxin